MRICLKVASFVMSSVAFAWVAAASAETYVFRFKPGITNVTAPIVEDANITVHFPMIYSDDGVSTQAAIDNSSLSISTWLLSGSYPSGLSINSSGLITGNLASGTHGPFSVTARLSNGRDIVSPPQFLEVFKSISTDDLELSMRLDEFVFFPLDTLGGVAPITISFVDGTFPDGVYFSGSNIVGSPSEVGSYSVRFEVRDKNGRSAVVRANLEVD